MSKQIKQIQYLHINIAEIDTNDYIAVKSAISALYYNLGHVYPPKTVDRPLALLGIGYLAYKFNSGLPNDRKLTVKELSALMKMTRSKKVHVDAILSKYDFDFAKVEKVVRDNNFYTVASLYDHCFAVIQFLPDGTVKKEYPSQTNVRDTKARHWTKNTPQYINELIRAIQAYRENISLMAEDVHYYLSKIQKYVTWYMPTIRKCDNDEFLQFGWCCRCGEINPSIDEPYNITNYYSQRHKKDINICLCKGCSLPHARKGIDEGYVMLNYIEYSKALERFADGKFGQKATFQKHFNTPTEY